MWSVDDLDGPMDNIDCYEDDYEGLFERNRLGYHKFI